MKPSVRVGELGDIGLGSDHTLRRAIAWYRAPVFSQLLHEVPRHEFARLVNTHQGERHAKGFTCWAHTAMLFCSWLIPSLREICNGLACCVGKLVHLGITRGPSKSSLSYANVHRPAAIFEDLFWSMTHRFRARSQLGARTHAFRFKNKLLSSIRPPSAVPQSVSLGHVPPRQGRRRPTSCWTTTITCPPTC